eukprot:5553544-Pleurochrysis_carterae.AAC.1
MLRLNRHTSSEKIAYRNHACCNVAGKSDANSLLHAIRIKVICKCNAKSRALVFIQTPCQMLQGFGDEPKPATGSNFWPLASFQNRRKQHARTRAHTHAHPAEVPVHALIEVHVQALTAGRLGQARPWMSSS